MKLFEHRRRCLYVKKELANVASLLILLYLISGRLMKNLFERKMCLRAIKFEIKTGGYIARVILKKIVFFFLLGLSCIVVYYIVERKLSGGIKPQP